MIYTATFHFLAVQHEGEMKGAKDYTKHDMHILVLNIKLAGELSYDSLLLCIDKNHNSF